MPSAPLPANRSSTLAPATSPSIANSASRTRSEVGRVTLPRGADHAVFVERDARVLRTLKANLDSLGIGPGRARVRRAEALTALRSARGRKETYDLIFIDPPYDQAPDWGPGLSTVLPSLLRPAARVVVESDRRAPLRLELELERERRYGDTSITIHRHP